MLVGGAVPGGAKRFIVIALACLRVHLLYGALKYTYRHRIITRVRAASVPVYFIDSICAGQRRSVLWMDMHREMGSRTPELVRTPDSYLASAHGTCECALAFMLWLAEARCYFEL